MNLSSSAFIDGEMLPTQYTCDGIGINPPLSVEDIPSGTQSLALIVDDPDSPKGTFVHWLVYDMPVNSAINKNSSPGIQGVNSAGKNGWYSPCPGSGSHRYVFTCYALDKKLNLPPGKTKQDLLEAMNGHILAESKLAGRYMRKVFT